MAKNILGMILMILGFIVLFVGIIYSLFLIIAHDYFFNDTNLNIENILKLILYFSVAFFIPAGVMIYLGKKNISEKQDTKENKNA